MSYIIEGSRDQPQRALRGGAVYDFIGAVHVEGHKRAVDGSTRDAEGMSGAVVSTRARGAVEASGL